jgi:FlaA1/EpsC-like NDP-sugar epimerase
MHNLKYIEYKIFDSNRFSLSSKENNKIKLDLKNSKILIVGAAGSIGSEFVKRILDYKFDKLTLLDKDENSLVDLNRDINLFFPNIKKKVNYNVLDITSSNIDLIIKNNEISHYFNFAALKHVRSEENFGSINYMFKTNSFNFLPSKKFQLKKVFSISTDKSCYPESILGISKKIMEQNLALFKIKNSDIHVSSTRFANVAFSKGSILEFAFKRINEKLPFGIPKNIKRYFINHREACNLCFKSILPQGNGKITIPSEKLSVKEEYIYKVIEKLLKIKKTNYKFKKKVNIFKKGNLQIELKDQKNQGQKISETFKESDENFFIIKSDEEILVLPFLSDKFGFEKRITDIKKKIINSKNLNELNNLLKKNYKNYRPKNNSSKVSYKL